MSTPRPALRIAIVITLSLFFCMWYLPDLVRVAGYPDGDIGLRTDGKVVESVLNGMPAQLAGIRPGERIDLGELTPTDRESIIGGYMPSPGRTVTIEVRRGNRYVPVRLRAAPEQTAGAFIVIREIVFVLPLLIGIFLVLLRPSPITWGFFLFSLGAGGSPPTSVFSSRVISDWNAYTVIGGILSLLVDVLPKAGLVLFAFSLARKPFGFWPRAAIVMTAAIGVIQSIPVFLFPDTAGFGWAQLNAGGDSIAAVIALSGLLFAYAHVAVRLRQRLHWITVGFVYWIIIDVLDAFLWPGYEPYWLHTAMDASQIIFPLTVAYAIFRERVVDINFVVSRTVAYGLLTTVIVGIFALIDLFLSRTMESRFSLPVDIVVALVLGFFFHGMRKRIDATVDRVVFRKRHVAESRLAKAAKAVVHVDDSGAIADYLTRLPAEVLDLTGAALYMRRGGGFALERCAGWKHEPPDRLPTSDPLVAFISAELGTVRVGDVPMREAPLDRHDSPVLAIPLVFRRELAGFALYGAHEDGADLDSDDERALVPLVNNAAVTYDHIEAQALREEIQRLRSLEPAMT